MKNSKSKNSTKDLLSFICYKLLDKNINNKEKEILNLVFQEFHDFDVNPLVPNSSMIAFLMSGCGLDYSQVLSSALNSFGEAHLPITKIVVFITNDFKTTEKYYPGFGHPIYKKNDPRVTKLIQAIKNIGYKTPHVDSCIKFSQEKNICLNIGGFSTALLLDVGFDINNIHYLLIISRMLGISNVYKTVKKNKLRFVTSTDNISNHKHLFSKERFDFDA